MKKVFGMASVVLAALALVLVAALAQPGDRDPTWGDEGLTLTSFGEGDDMSTANALMEDGKWVLSGWVNVYPGDFGAARYLTNGELDPSFGEDGLVVTSFTDDPELVDSSWATGERPNGGLFLQGETCDADYIVCELAVAAYLEDGTLDPSFGGDGLVTTDPGTAGVLSWPGRLIVHADGSLTTGGIVFQDDDSVDMVMVRYNADGSLDDSFGAGGIAITDLAGDDDFLSDMLALPGDKILATGAFATPVSSTWAEPVVGVLARMNDDGSLDTTFGDGDGFVTWESGGDTTGPLASLITPDNQIMVFGYMGTPDGRDCFLRRYDIDGELDTSFGADGQVTIDSGQDDDCREMALTPHNKLALAWGALPFDPEARASAMTTRRDIARSRLGAQSRQVAQVESFESVLARYNLDGTPDASFGLNGLRRYSESEVGVFYQLAIQPDGKFLVGGDYFVDGFVDFGAVRLVDTQTQPARPGDPDPTWGDKGMTLTDFDGMDDYANANALMEDGRWVIVGWANIFPGDFGVVRYLANGQLDPTFGDGGKVVTAFTDDPELVDAAWQAAARSNGGIFAIGETCDADYNICQLAVAAYMADGSLDESFGNDGLVVTDPGAANAFAWSNRPIVQPDEKLVVGGVVFQDDDSVDLLFIRYHPDGSLDDTFGDGGISIFDLAGVDNFVNDIVALPGNKFLAVGGFGAFVDPISSVPSDAGLLARVNSDGSLDMTFGGGDGYITWDNDGELTEGRQGLITPDNKILVLGHMAADDGSDCSLQRYDMDGNLDTTFGEEGLVIIDTGQYDECLRMALTPDGKLVIAGPAAPAPEEGLAAGSGMSERTSQRLARQSQSNRSAQDEPFENLIARYNLEGTPDATFGQNGQSRFSINGGAGRIYQLAVQRDGKILVAGDVIEGDFIDIGALRFLGDGPAAQVFAPVIRR